MVRATDALLQRLWGCIVRCLWLHQQGDTAAKNFQQARPFRMTLEWKEDQHVWTVQSPAREYRHASCLQKFEGLMASNGPDTAPPIFATSATFQTAPMGTTTLRARMSRTMSRRKSAPFHRDPHQLALRTCSGWPGAGSAWVNTASAI